MSTTFQTARDRVRQWRSYPAELHSRLRALEEGLQEQRQLARRVAEVTDLVTELLVPLAEQDRDRARELVERYRASI